jgi:tetratricopeptide (TPR) repeat protein
MALQRARECLEQGDSAGAEARCRDVLQRNGRDPEAHHLLAVICAGSGRLSDAARHLGVVTEIRPGSARAHGDLARVQALQGRHDLALASIERALGAQPGSIEVLVDKADLLERGGRHDEAWAILEPLMRSGSLSEDAAPVAMRVLEHRGRPDEAAHLGRTMVARPAESERARRFLLLQLGRTLDRLGDTDSAFRAFESAKRMERHAFDAAGHVRAVDALLESYSREALARLPRARCESEVPIFVASMPRAGSTLVEQIIHAHPDAHGAGEIPAIHEQVCTMQAELGARVPYPACIKEVGQERLDRMSAAQLAELVALGGGAARVVNKHLLNDAHLGLIALLFPRARVIHVRRDRRDNGLACFMASLSPAIMPWARDLASIRVAFDQHERLMEHWKAVLPLPILDVRYEDLVQDTEAEIRRIIEFCGLPWDERCLRFWEAPRVVLTPSYDQVRRPIFRSALGRWRRYEAFLGPLL